VVFHSNRNKTTIRKNLKKRNFTVY